MTPEFTGLRKRNFQGIIFTLTQTYRENLKSASASASEMPMMLLCMFSLFILG